MNEETLRLIAQVLNRGNTVELKKEKDRLVVVEIRRKVVEKTTMIS